MNWFAKLRYLLYIQFLFCNFLFAQTDSSQVVSLNLFSSAFFDNKEFTGNIKKGYTHPGFFLQPTVRLETKGYTVDAGFHMLYLAGTDSLESFLPVISLQYNITPSFQMIVGTLKSKDNHHLPEPLFKTERNYLNQPEVGVQYKMDTQRFKGDLWINWERYIKKGSPFQEQFTVGLVSLFKPSTFDVKTGTYLSLVAMVTHQGGQIDSTDLPVTTILNTGGTVGYLFDAGIGNAVAKIEFNEFLSTHNSSSLVKKFKEGTAFQPKIALIWPNIKVELGYWYANSFYNPRGEELFGSTSTVSASFDEKTRSLVTLELSLFKLASREFSINTGFNAYYDTKNNIIEYSYVFKIIFDGKIFSKL